MIKVIFPWAFDHPWLWPVLALPLGWLIWHLRHTGLKVALILLLGALPYGLLMLAGVEDGCTSADPPAKCFGWAMAFVFTIVGITPLWLGSLGLGAWLRHWQARKKSSPTREGGGPQG